MKISMIDAIDAFGIGGFIDLETLKWIGPKWFSELHPANNTGLTDGDYAQIITNSTRYLKTPVCRTIGLACSAALQMGMPRGLLVDLGMTKDEYWDIFHVQKENDNEESQYGMCDEEWAVIDGIKDYMLTNKMYNQYIFEKNALYKKIIRDWLVCHGLEVEDE